MKISLKGPRHFLGVLKIIEKILISVFFALVMIALEFKVLRYVSDVTKIDQSACVTKIRHCLYFAPESPENLALTFMYSKHTSRKIIIQFQLLGGFGHFSICGCRFEGALSKHPRSSNTSPPCDHYGYRDEQEENPEFGGQF